MLRVVTFNVNSIRSRMHQLEQLVTTRNPNIIGLQETKVTDEQFPVELVQALGYHVEYFGQKTHYGVALMSRQRPSWVEKGYPGDDENAQRRFIAAGFPHSKGELIVVNGYFPQGENRIHPLKFPAKQKYYADLLQWLETRCTPDQPVIVMGDMNISPEDIDIGIGEDNAKRWLRTGKCSFLPEEREWLGKLRQWGLTDLYRQQYPDQAGHYSWFDYRSGGFEQEPKRGLRIDLIMATKSLAAQVQGCGIDYTIRAMEKPSDHCPVWADLNV